MPVITTQTLSESRLREMASPWLTADASSPLRVFKDTTQFFNIEYGDIILLEKNAFLVRHNAREGRFGLDDEVKFWVKRCIDLDSGTLKIVKLVFYEEFLSRIGNIEFKCNRSPRKEARVLSLVAAHPNFMHGYTVPDPQGNLVRVIDYIYGKTLAAHIEGLKMDHQVYFETYFPEVLKGFIECVAAIRFLHIHGEKHGDIRRDHIIMDREKDGTYRWIDYDYTYQHRESKWGYDLFGLGNVLMFLVGKGDVLMLDLHNMGHPALGHLREDDMNIVFHNRVANLRKVYPYIPDRLNRILLHFSKGAPCFYETTSELLEDLEEYRASC
jgi:hypothetical protein